ncbi:MAG: NIPSNAP family protein [Candidatus Eremiobacteraeota bacterium]|nr:NIPSNAP family protein [Candidatus Eremiobacteraeota bacterium]
MNDNPVESQFNGVITEIRTYRIKTGRREDFLRLFDTSVAPLLRSQGIAIVGPFRDIESNDTIVWLRTFPSLDDRKRMLDAFYESVEWESGLKEITGDMIESQSQAVVLLPEWILDGVH